MGLETSSRVHGAARAIAAATAGRPGWGRSVPGATSVLVRVDPIEPGVDAAAAELREIVGAGELRTSGAARSAGVVDRPTVIIPVRYGGADGPDLEAVAELAGLAPDAVAEAHAAVLYHALFLGFAPGFAYLGTLPPELVVPRRSEPRVRVPAGTVGLAGAQTAVYPIESPGGWQLIGRTSLQLWDPRRSAPALIQPGDTVRFVPQT